MLGPSPRGEKSTGPRRHAHSKPRSLLLDHSPGTQNSRIPASVVLGLLPLPVVASSPGPFFPRVNHTAGVCACTPVRGLEQLLVGSFGQSLQAVVSTRSPKVPSWWIRELGLGREGKTLAGRVEMGDHPCVLLPRPSHFRGVLKADHSSPL